MSLFKGVGIKWFYCILYNIIFILLVVFQSHSIIFSVGINEMKLLTNCN